MPAILKNVLAVFAGLLLGCVVNMGVISVGPLLIPLPEGVDMSDRDTFAENFRLLQPINFVVPWVAHALGTFVGAAVAAKLAASHKMKIALGIGVLFLACGIAMVVWVGGPLWFIALDLIGAYLPMGFMGGRLVSAKTPLSAKT